MIRHKTPNACLDILKLIIEALLNGEINTVYIASVSSSVLHVKIYVDEPSNVGIVLGKSQEMKQALLKIIRQVGHYNHLTDIFIRIDDKTKLEVQGEEEKATT